MKDYLPIRLIIALALICILASCTAPGRQVLHNEKDFQKAFNKVYFKGKAEMEVPVKYGRVDLLSDDYAIEVDRLEKFHEAIGQALHYAKETGKKPAIAIFILDHEPGDREKLKYVQRLCDYYKIQFWYINEELKKAKKK
ncbi:MAG: hypothetical protein AB2L12_05670 [Smithellaceae bacterium]